METHIDLSPREQQILALLVKGKTNKEIALELGICRKTVEFHLANIYSKIKVRTRTEAVIQILNVELGGI